MIFVWDSFPVRSIWRLQQPCSGRICSAVTGALAPLHRIPQFFAVLFLLRRIFLFSLSLTYFGFNLALYAKNVSSALEFGGFSTS